MKEGLVLDGQLCEHLGQAQMKLLAQSGGAWSYIVMPTSLHGRPVRIDRLNGGYRVTHAKAGQTVDDLKGEQDKDEEQPTT